MYEFFPSSLIFFLLFQVSQDYCSLAISLVLLLQVSQEGLTILIKWAVFFLEFADTDIKANGEYATGETRIVRLKSP